MSEIRKLEYGIQYSGCGSLVIKSLRITLIKVAVNMFEFKLIGRILQICVRLALRPNLQHALAFAWRLFAFFVSIRNLRRKKKRENRLTRQIGIEMRTASATETLCAEQKVQTQSVLGFFCSSLVLRSCIGKN